MTTITTEEQHFQRVLQYRSYISATISTTEIESLNWLKALYQTSWNVPTICSNGIGIKCTPDGNILSIESFCLTFTLQILLQLHRLLDAAAYSSTTSGISTTTQSTGSSGTPASTVGSTGASTSQATLSTGATDGSTDGSTGASTSQATMSTGTTDGSTDASTIGSTGASTSQATMSTGSTDGSTDGSTGVSTSQGTTTSGTIGSTAASSTAGSTGASTSQATQSSGTAAGSTGTSSGSSTSQATADSTTTGPQTTTKVTSESIDVLDPIPLPSVYEAFNVYSQPSTPVNLPVLTFGTLDFPFLTNLTILGTITPAVTDVNILQYISSLNALVYVRINNQPYVADFSSFPSSGQTLLKYLMVDAGIPLSIWSSTMLETIKLSGNRLGLSSTATSNSIRFAEIDFSSGGGTFNIGGLMSTLTVGDFGFYVHINNIILDRIQSLTFRSLLVGTRIELGFQINVPTSLFYFSAYNCKLVTPLPSTVTALQSVELYDVTYDNPATLYLTTIPFSLIHYSEKNGVAQALPSTVNNVATFNVNSNPNFSPSFTYPLCTVRTIDARSTGLTAAAIDNCFVCYSNQFDMRPWFDFDITFNPSLCASYLTLSATQFMVGRDGGVITLEGTGMGWGVGSGVYPDLTCVVPNKKFLLAVPAYAGVQTLTLNLGFSATMKKAITITYGVPKISSVEFIQGAGLLTVVLNGTFFENPAFTVGGVSCSITVYGVNTGVPTSYQCTLPQDFKEGYTLIVASGNVYGNDSRIFYYLRSYPLVTSTSEVPSNGGILTLYGRFIVGAGKVVKDLPISHDLPTTTPITINPASSTLAQLGVQSVSSNLGIPTVTVGGNPCTNVMYDATQLNCTLDKDTRGPKEIVVTIDTYTFRSKGLFFLGMFDAPTCPSACPAHSTCDTTKGTCVCDTGYAGPTCAVEVKPDAPNATIEASPVKPDTSISTPSGSLLDIQIVGIAEIDLDGAVVVEIPLSGEWDNRTTTTSSANTTHSYLATNIYGNATVQAQLIAFHASSSVEFAGKTDTYESGSLKVQLGIYDWPFVASTNTLRVIIHSATGLTDAAAESRCTDAVQSSDVGVDEFDSVNYLVMTIDTIAYYGRFIDRSLSDGRPAYSPVSVLNKTDGAAFLSISLPHCVVACVLDPDFSILLTNKDEDDGCSDSNSRAWVIPVAVVVPCVVVAAGVATFFAVKRRFYVSRSGLSVKIISRGKSQRSISMKVPYSSP
ncbi:hypothetical protein DFA_01744 [Cavenderia fasciculata]|uniref:EGF-like domain-containing protein n=1 Tax=Cavenderia fasciculata TaxID=261658 RepID=F4PUJ4_CACFS|nr:uncharacterized protein DFA_01744 [Cavenderia fasciculata]EGG21858.1 hypothetical protein DFA_01744 [Cavenderia fasciculata]|eukprot:XP_004359709.1 hypothetical protein DFA_01744 [Cavenderia fasciculata]